MLEVDPQVREDLGRCLEEHLPVLFHTALGLLGRPDEAEDAVQETALRAIRSLPGFRSEADICTWVHRILINRCHDQLSGRSRHEDQLSPEAVDSLWQDPNYTVDPAIVFQHLSDHDRLVEALSQIGTNQRAVVVMHDSHGWKLHEIAAALSMPLPTAKSHLRRGRQALVTILSREGEDSHAT